ncbi:hypothetical protein UFOVP73_60 [uncultured Caudovirales phage]|uniref:Uncharacterized protein n=1 Tax=uncultured Caudovirales phage TaxID=2100421 RepID=A0A6J5KXV7_9CAUD|nr:hypothetical protein UFOVP73_60 [uncultured Caudovirales phage]CAB5194738.1 hypothetical protein UFOVP170_20 [uncultured Caudovirales phage]
MPAQMPQYVAQPSTEGPQPDVTGVNMKVFSGKFGQPIYGPQKEYSPTMAVPAWARAQPTAQPAFTGALFGSQPNPYTAPQSVQQPGSAAPAAKGAK